MDFCEKRWFKKQTLNYQCQISLPVTHRLSAHKYTHISMVMKAWVHSFWSIFKRVSLNKIFSSFHFFLIFLSLHFSSNENMFIKTKLGDPPPCLLPLDYSEESNNTRALWVTGVVVLKLKMCTEKILKQKSVNRKCK